MRRSTFILASALCVSIATANLVQPAQAQKSAKLSKCDGSKKRSANPYGSVLPTLDIAKLAPSGPQPIESKSDINVFSKPKVVPTTNPNEAAPKVPEISLSTQLLTFASC